MTALIRKEVRLILPSWIAALILAVGSAFFGPDLLGYEIAGSSFSIAALILGLASFGQECSFGTLSSLLVQPVSRVRIWRTKAMVLAAALVITMGASFLAYRLRMHERAIGVELVELFFTLFLLVLLAFSGGLWATLLFRQVAAAFWYALLVPLAIAIGGGLFWDQASSWSVVTVSLLFGYTIAGYLFARRMFMRAQDVHWTGATLALPAWLDRERKPNPSSTACRKAPLHAFISKEIRSHQASLIIAAVLLVLHAIVILVRKSALLSEQPNHVISALLEFWWVIWVGLPLLVGSSSVAEERRLGTLESQLCLPLNRTHQFVSKLLIALVLGMGLGGILPWVMEAFGTGAVSMIGSWNGLAALCLVSAGITLLAFYASTLSRNSLHAMGAAIGLGIVLGSAVSWAVSIGQNTNVSAPWGIPLVGYATFLILIPMILLLAARNFKKVQIDGWAWGRDAALLVLSLGLAFTASAALYNRPWELVMRLEPTHGPAVLNGPVRPALHSVALKLFALLPDGRIWVSTRYQPTVFHQYEGPEKGWEKITLPLPNEGRFLEESNWVQLASNFRHAAGVRSDGTLWRILELGPATDWRDVSQFSTYPKPEQIGNETNWLALAAGSLHFVALKRDGTVWSWGDIYKFHIGDQPQQIGTDSDWKSIFAAEAHSIGIKTDGSLWKWGRLYEDPEGEGDTLQSPYSQPVRWNVDAKDWEALDDWGFTKVVRKDGTFWVSGGFPKRVFGLDLPPRKGANLVQVGTDSRWAAIVGGYESLGALKRDGIFLYQSDPFAQTEWPKGPQRPSKYSDWIALSSGLLGREMMTLAADGTLCCWGNPLAFRTIFGPSRKPFWSLNLLSPTDTTSRDTASRAR